MVRSRKPASSSAAITWSRPRISTQRLPLPRGFPAPGMVRSKSDRSGFIIDGYSHRHSRMRRMAQARNPYSRSGLWVPGSLVSLASGMTGYLREWLTRMTPTEIEKIFRDEAGRALATLIRLVGDFDLAEGALQDAFAVALERWPAVDPPSNPRAWLVNVGRNKAIDRVRRRIAFRGTQGE